MPFSSIYTDRDGRETGVIASRGGLRFLNKVPVQDSSNQQSSIVQSISEFAQSFVASASLVSFSPQTSQNPSSVPQSSLTYTPSAPPSRLRRSLSRFKRWTSRSDASSATARGSVTVTNGQSTSPPSSHALCSTDPTSTDTIRRYSENVKRMVERTASSMCSSIHTRQSKSGYNTTSLGDIKEEGSEEDQDTTNCGQGPSQTCGTGIILPSLTGQSPPPSDGGFTYTGAASGSNSTAAESHSTVRQPEGVQSLYAKAGGYVTEGLQTVMSAGGMSYPEISAGVSSYAQSSLAVATSFSNSGFQAASGFMSSLWGEQPKNTSEVVSGDAAARKNDQTFTAGGDFL